MLKKSKSKRKPKNYLTENVRYKLFWKKNSSGYGIFLLSLFALRFFRKTAKKRISDPDLFLNRFLRLRVDFIFFFRQNSQFLFHPTVTFGLYILRPRNRHCQYFQNCWKSISHDHWYVDQKPFYWWLWYLYPSRHYTAAHISFPQAFFSKLMAIASSLLQAIKTCPQACPPG